MDTSFDLPSSGSTDKIFTPALQKYVEFKKSGRIQDLEESVREAEQAAMRGVCKLADRLHILQLLVTVRFEHDRQYE